MTVEIVLASKGTWLPIFSKTARMHANPCSSTNGSVVALICRFAELPTLWARTRIQASDLECCLLQTVKDNSASCLGAHTASRRMWYHTVDGTGCLGHTCTFDLWDRRCFALQLSWTYYHFVPAACRMHLLGTSLAVRGLHWKVWMDQDRFREVLAGKATDRVAWNRCQESLGAPSSCC
jgi:hypothetical protein